MFKKIRKMLAMLVALSMLLSIAHMGFAEGKGTVEVETLAGVNEKVSVSVDTETSTDSDGSASFETVKTESSAEGATTEYGMIVDYEGSSTVTTEVTTDAEGNIVGSEIVSFEGSTEYSVTNADGSYTAQGGSEIVGKPEENPGTMDGAEVEIPQQPGAFNTVEGDPAGTVIDETGDGRESPSDGEYDYIGTVVVTPGSVTVGTTDVTYTENVVPGSDTLEHVKSETESSNDNEMFDWNFRGSYLGTNKNGVITEGYIHLLEDIEYDMANGTNTAGINAKDGFAYVYIGGENTSQIMPTFLFTSPSEEYPDQEPIIINGKEYYLRDYNGIPIDTIYKNGENIEIKEGEQPQIFSVPEQFLLYDPVNKKLVTTYCADIETPTETGFNYNIANVEDAGYYSDAEAAMIRAIALNGYWGTTSGIGSLEAMKENMWATGMFGSTEEDRARFDELMTEGVALTATQMAIWTYSNNMSDIEFLNAANSKAPGTGIDAYGNEIPGVISSSWASGLGVKHNEDREATYDILYLAYAYLINLDPMPANNDPANPVKTTANTIVNADNFIERMKVVIIGLDEAHKNNKDDDKNNDVYICDLIFSLDVEPVGDDCFEVTFIGFDGEEHKSIIVSKDKESTTEGALQSDDKGNYTITGLSLIEGIQQLEISLVGVQNLQEGVYLYTSEVTEEGMSSQTLVGMAGGQHMVDVTMTTEFEFNVDEQIVIDEHVWREEDTDNEPTPNDPTPEDPTPNDPTPEDPTPNDPTPEDPTPNDPTPEDPTPEDPTPEDPTPEDPTPEDPTPEIDPPFEDLITRLRITRDALDPDTLFGDLLVISDYGVPLAAVPSTGDGSGVLIVISMSSLVGIVLLARKRRIA